MAKRKPFRVEKEVRKLARERVGPVPAGHAIPPKPKRRKAPKHPKKEQENWLDS